MKIDLSISDDIAIIHMDDGKKNAVTLDSLRVFNKALDEAEEV